MPQTRDNQGKYSSGGGGPDAGSDSVSKDGPFGSPGGDAQAQYDTVRALGKNPGLPLKTLGKFTGHSSGTLSKALSAGLKAGYLSRSEGGRYHLTNAGKSLLEKIG